MRDKNNKTVECALKDKSSAHKFIEMNYSKTFLKRSLKEKTNIGFQDQLSRNAGQQEHSAILLTFIKLPFVKKILVLSIFEWLYTGFTVDNMLGKMPRHAKRFAICKSDQHHLICKSVTLIVLNSHCNCQGHASLMYKQMQICRTYEMLVSQLWAFIDDKSLYIKFNFGRGCVCIISSHLRV